MSRAEVKGSRITWLCAKCGLPIAKGAGYVEANMEAAHTHREAWREFDKRKRAESGDGLLVYNLAEFPDVDPARWNPWHQECDPDIDASSYWIDVGRCRSLAQLVHWAGHLMNKNWIGDTDWSELLLELGEYS